MAVSARKGASTGPGSVRSTPRASTPGGRRCGSTWRSVSFSMHTFTLAAVNSAWRMRLPRSNQQPEHRTGCAAQQGGWSCLSPGWPWKVSKLLPLNRPLCGDNAVPPMEYSPGGIPSSGT
jgi:hypothetical protein